jgi:chromosome segregation ATPase
LTPGLPHTLEEGDVVQLGIPIASDKPAEFIWQFFQKLPVKKHMRVLSNNSQESLEADNDGTEVKRHCSNDSVLALKQKDISSTVWSPGVNLRQKLDEQNRVLESRLQREKERLNSLNGSTANTSFDLKLQEEREQKLRMEQLLREQEEKLQRLQQELDDKRHIEVEAKVREEEMSRLQNELEMRAAAEEALREKQRQYEMELQKKVEAEEQLQKLQHELLEREEANRKMAAEINAREAEQKEYLEALQVN